MTFVIYGAYKKEEAKKLEKILRALYGSVEIIIMNSKPSTSSVATNSHKDYKLFSIGTKSSPDKSFDGKVLNVKLEESADKIIYDIISFVDLGVSDKVVVKALVEAK